MDKNDIDTKAIVDKIYKLQELLLLYKHTRLKDSFYGSSVVQDQNFKASHRQFDIIFLIFEKEIKNLSQIAKKLKLSTSSLSIIVSKMVKSGLVIKDYSDSEDARLVTLSLTEDGEKFYVDIKNKITKKIILFINSLDDEERQFYFDALIDVSKVFKKKIDISVKFQESETLQANQIFENISTLKFVMERLIREIKNESGNILHSKEFNILNCIKTTKLHTPSEIAKEQFSSESVMSTQLKSLVKKNMLKKQKEDGDIRKTYFYLTDEGIEVIDKCYAATTISFTNAINKLDDNYKKSLDSGLTNLIKLFTKLTKI